MNSVVILIFGLIALTIGYFVYARFIAKLFGVDFNRQVPSVSKCDGVDFVPAQHWLMVFGHHFASIAGAGPIVGPVLACIYWGWGPALAWIIIGTIFIGGVHDFGSLFVSIREDACSIPEVAQRYISKTARNMFSIFTWFALLLVVAVFAYLCSMTFVKNPFIVLPSLGVIPVALLTGFFIYRFKFNLIFTTVIGLLLMLGLMFLGKSYPIDLGENAFIIWTIILLVYAYIASVLPVNILLQPRDYLSSFFLFFALIAGIVGIFVSNPKIVAPAFKGVVAPEGGFVWPMLFVIIACGAISGFHSMVASGTTSKQITSEAHIAKIGYGAMVFEAVLAIVVLICVSIGISGGFKKGEEILYFSRGFEQVTSSFLRGYGGVFAILTLNAFILTTLDTATRINRYITEDIFRIKNRFISTFVVIILAAALVISGSWKKIWPVFGASNQLVAALTLLVLSAWLLSRNKKIRYTIIPAIVMLITTIAALVIQIVAFIKLSSYLLAAICILLIIFSIIMLKESIKVMIKRKLKQ